MKRLFLTIVFSLFATTSAAHAQVDFFYSTSGTEATAGTTLDLNFGESGSMFVWMTNNEASGVTGVSLDMVSSNVDVLEALGFTFNDAVVWNGTNIVGGIGDLVSDARAVSILGTAVPASETVMLGEINFEATAVGGTTLTLNESTNPITVTTGLPVGGVNFGSGSINVVNAIPEPSAFALGMVALCGLTARRRFRAV